MRFLLCGPGDARDHAVFEALSREKDNIVLMAKAAGSGPNVLLTDQPNNFVFSGLQDLLELAHEFRPDITVFLNPSHARNGIIDAVRESGLLSIGPTKSQNSLEDSKICGKEFMIRNSIPTPDFSRFDDSEKAATFLRDHWINESRRFVIKTDDSSLPASERTFVPENIEDALSRIDYLRTTYGKSKTLLIEQRVFGWECSIHMLLSGNDYICSPLTFDYKPLLDGDHGINTGGIGSLGIGNVEQSLYFKEIVSKIADPTMRGLLNDGISYCGFIHLGVIWTDSGPMLLEYNTRPGNPEWSALMCALETPLGELFKRMVNGSLRDLDVRWRHEFSVAVATMLRPDERYTEGRGHEITLLDSLPSDIHVHGNLIKRNDNGQLIPCGERAFVVVGCGKDLAKLHGQIYEVVQKMSGKGLYFRKDIGKNRPVGLFAKWLPVADP